MNSFGTILGRRLTTLIARYGQPVIVRRGSSTYSATARVSVMSTATRYNYFRQDESQNWAFPAYSLTIGGDFALPIGAVVAGDEVEIDGTFYPVRRVDKARVGNVVYKTVLFVARMA